MARRLIALALFAPAMVLADEPCMRRPDGVHCTETGFAELVRVCVTDRRDLNLALVAQQQVTADLDDARKIIASLEERLKAPPPAPPEPPRSMKPLVAFTLGVVGTGLAATAAAWSSAPAQVRVGLGTAGVVAGVGGLWFAW